MLRRCLVFCLLGELIIEFTVLCDTTIQNSSSSTDNKGVLEKVKKWAPLIWLSPGEEFFPSDASSFLQHVHVQVLTDQSKMSSSNRWKLLRNHKSLGSFLVTNESIEHLLQDKTSMIYGDNSKRIEDIKAPVYARVVNCPGGNGKTFHVMYWQFYPYNQGKKVCMATFGHFSFLPVPRVNGKCLARLEEYGNHVGDWEHMSLHFKGDDYPSMMFVAVHNTGAYYKYDPATKQFKYQNYAMNDEFQQQRLEFPKIVKTTENHPILFSAKGSHGLWASPGKHEFLRVPKLYDETGYGYQWSTWKSIKMVDDTLEWMTYKGKWGNPRSSCHPLSTNICRWSDGPYGIPMKKDDFTCLP